MNKGEINLAITMDRASSPGAEMKTHAVRFGLLKGETTRLDEATRMKAR